MRVIVAGPRDWTDRDRVWGVLFQELTPGDFIITGGASGVDSLAAEWAAYTRHDQRCFPANWAEQGKAAGPLRNARMIREGQADHLIAFARRKGISRGTHDMIQKALTKHLSVKVFYEDGEGETFTRQTGRASTARKKKTNVEHN